MRLHAPDRQGLFGPGAGRGGRALAPPGGGEAPHLREPWLDLADLAYQREDWPGVLWATGRVLAITRRPRTYISEAEAWGRAPGIWPAWVIFTPASMKKALESVEKALALAPEDLRLQKNHRLMAAKVEQSL